MLWACDECDTVTTVFMAPNDTYYCGSCWKWHEMRNTRCFTFAAAYDETTCHLLGTASSSAGVGCAERILLWNLSDELISTPKVLIVARIRRNRNNKKMSFGGSKPCNQCIQAMHFYGVTRVAYSNGDSFTWSDLQSLHNEYKTYSASIVLY